MLVIHNSAGSGKQGIHGTWDPRESLGARLQEPQGFIGLAIQGLAIQESAWGTEENRRGPKTTQGYPMILFVIDRASI